MQSDDDEHSSSSSQSSHSGSSSPEAPTLTAAPVDGDVGSDSDSDTSLHSKGSKTLNSKQAQGSDEESGSDSEDDNLERPPSSSTGSSENDDRGHGSDQDENDASSHGSRSRSASASSGRSRSSEHSDSDGDATSGNLKKLWERDPDFYGVRRSSRNREGTPRKPPKLVAQVKRKVPPKKTPPKKRKISSDRGDSSDEEMTRSVRQRGSAVCYKENESDEYEMSADEGEGDESQNGEESVPEEHVETIERVMDIRDGKKGATGSSTTIYAILKNGDPNLTLPEETEIEKQFLIKWIGWSHLHNTWESIDTLQELKVKGLKKLDNYCKKEDELSRWKKFASPEDVEYYECQLELQQELAKCYINVERIIETRTGDEGLEYYVKWDCLPYSEATWENASLIRDRNPEAIEIFKKRENSHRTPPTGNSTGRSFRNRPKFVPLKEQPAYMQGDNGNLALRDYQLDGLNWLIHSWCKDNSVILADEMGLGKTIQTICFLSYLFETQDLYGPYLIVVPLSTMAAWQREFAQWAPQINVVTYLGDITSRDIIREHEWYFKTNGRCKFNCLLTTYEIVLKDKQFLTIFSWAILMVDEAHRLKNGDSLLYKSLQEFTTYHRLLITGTPLQNSLKELWSLLHFIMPIKFDDWEYFEEEHDQAAAKGYAKLHKQLEPFILRRVKKDVEKSLPAKVEQILRVEMTTLQKQYYKWILTKNYSALRKGIKGSVSSFINVVMELKKCCNHATLVKPVENPSGDTVTQLIKGSGKLMLLDKLLVRLKETGHRVLIFSQMVRMLDIIAEYLQLRRFSFQRLDGSIKGDLRKQALDHFNAEGSSDFCFLLSTRAGGLGINLATADTVIIFDSDWNPQNDLQAQARAHRIGQKNQVNIYRLVTKNSVEEDIVERAKKKMVLDHLVIQRMDTTGRTVLDKGSKTATPFNKDELTAILKFGAEELFKEDDNEGEDQCDIDDILRRAETHEDSGEKPGDELLSAFKVASFNVTEEEEEQIPLTINKDWDQIIPENIRKQVEAEEKEKEMADLFLPPRSSRAVLGPRPQDNGTTGTNTKEALQKISRKRKRGEESEESESEDDGTAKKKKRGRPKGHGKDGGLKGFTNAQIKRFIKSMKRFPKPLLRIETLAADAELGEKSFADLKKLAEALVKSCRAAMLEAKKNPALINSVVKDESNAGGVDGEPGVGGTPAANQRKQREKGPLFNFNGTTINARTFSIALDELEPLGEAIPKDPEGRKNWKFELKAKVPQFDVEWGPEEDTQLLLAVWEYGTAAWEKIRELTPLLKEKIFTDGEKKPQIKHVQARTDHLIKVIKKHLLLTQKHKLTGKGKKKKEKKEKLAVDGKPEGGVKVEGEPKEKKPRAKKPKKGKDSGPMHFTANTKPTSVKVLGDMDPSVFQKCKDQMRPVKKALQSLDNPDPSLSDKEQIRHVLAALLQIGDLIQTLLEEYKDKEQMNQWKSHLWVFASQFTEKDANALYKLYKKATKKADKGDKSKRSKKSEKDKGSKRSRKESKDESDGENRGRRSSSSQKHDRDRDKRRESRREKRRNSQENSNSTNDHQERDRPYKAAPPYYERDRERDRDRDRDREREREREERDRERERFAYSCGEDERISAAPPPNHVTSAFDSSGSSYGSSSHYGSPQKYRSSNGLVPYSHSPNNAIYDGVARNDSHYHNNGPSSSYNRGRDRERAPGDPRDRVGIHAGKNYHYNNSFDRDRGSIPERGGGFSGRSAWSGGGQKERWSSSQSHYGGDGGRGSGVRRDDGSGYYPGSLPNTNGPPPPFVDGRGRGGGPPAPYGGRGGMTTKI